MEFLSTSEDSNAKVPFVQINSPVSTSKSSRGRRKQEHPQRALKQLASVADKILHGIIIIEPILPWEQNMSLTLPPMNRFTSGYSYKRSSGEESDGGNFISSPMAFTVITPKVRPTVTRSPAPMGIPLQEDSMEPGLSNRRDLYEQILNKRRNSPSRSGMPLDICSAPGSSLLDDSEFEVCSTLRLYPLQYFQSRDTLTRNYQNRGFYRKSAAQKMLHIDVNKTGKLYDYFVSRNWMPVSFSSKDIAMVRPPSSVGWHAIEPN